MDKIEITPELLADLKAKAEKATPGDWMERCGNSVIAHDYNIAAHVVRVDDARYIAAANPSVMLALLARIEELEANNYGPDILNDPQAITASYFAGRMSEGRKNNAEIDKLNRKEE